jgi:hypothetical protein
VKLVLLDSLQRYQKEIVYFKIYIRDGRAKV